MRVCVKEGPFYWLPVRLAPPQCPCLEVALGS